jgi:murein DD-endopeptidase MepM/ murein hydrolase activator NlpD
MRTLVTLLIAGLAVSAATLQTKPTAKRTVTKKPVAKRVVRRRAAPVVPVTQVFKARYVQPDLTNLPDLAPPLPDLVGSELQDSFFAYRVGRRVHQAIDIMRPSGTPLLACIDGYVERIQTSRLGGKSIYLTDPERQFHFFYAHLSGYAEGITEGMPVTRGTLIGYVGNTGNARFTGPHLHFQIMREAAGTVNPYPLLHGLLEGFIPIRKVPPTAVIEGMKTDLDSIAQPVSAPSESRPLLVPEHSVVVAAR